MRKEYGVDDFGGTGFFILPDGQFLSGGGGGTRTAEHAGIEQFLLPKARARFHGAYGGRVKSMRYLMRRVNLIRWIPEGWAAEVVMPPTNAQVRTLEGLAASQPLRLMLVKANKSTGELHGKKLETIVESPYEVPELIDDFYRRRSNPVDRLPGGLGDHAPVSSVSPRQLLRGIKVEMEHTKDPRIAREIAMDHLMELPDYYDRLATIEPAHNPPGGSTMSLKEVEKWVPEARKRGISKVARSGRGFVAALRRAGSVGKLPEKWKSKRKAFIARHMAQTGNETLWEGGKPSGRALALMMWAFKPARSNPVSRSHGGRRGYGRGTMPNPVDPFAETAVMTRPKKGTAAFRRKRIKVGDTDETVTVTMDLNHVAVPEMLAGKRYRSVESARKAYEAINSWRRVAGFVARNGL